MSIPQFSVSHKVTTTMLILIIVVVGIIAYNQLGLELFPEIEYPQITVVTAYKGASSEDIESMITKPVESWISTVNKVKNVRSFSQEGLSLIVVEFEWGTNLDYAAQDVRDRIALYKFMLPDGASDPLVYKFSLTDFPVLFYGVANPSLDERDLKTLIEKNVADRLERIDGIASAMVMSTKEREIEVKLNKSALESRGLTIDAVIASLRLENINLPAGYITRSHREYIIRTIGEFKTLDDIANTVIGVSQSGAPIYLRDVGEVVDGYKDIRNMARIQRGEGVLLWIQKSSEGNTVEVARKVKRELEEIKKTLPEGTNFYLTLDFSEFIELMASRTSNNALLGALLAITVLFIFIGNWRPTLTIGLSIPLSIIATFIALYAAGYTFNFITLVGLALGVGMMVDNAVVVIENIYRHIQSGMPKIKASSFGAEEVFLAITASTFTTIAVFFPMLFAKALVGKLARPFALTIAFGLLASLFVAITIVPMLASVIYKEEREKRVHYFDKFRAWYERALAKILKKRTVLLIAISVLFIFSIAVAVFFVGKEFFPSTDRSFFMMRIKLPVGTPLNETARVLNLLEERAIQEKSITSIMTFAGAESEEQVPSEFSASGPHEGFFMGSLVERSLRKESANEILERLRKGIPPYEHAIIEVIDMSSMGFGASTAPIEIKIFGDDLGILRTTGWKIIDEIKDIEGIRDLRLSLEKGKPEYHISINREKASRHGLKIAQVGSTIEAHTLGKVSTRYKARGEELDVRVRLNPYDLRTMEDILSIPIITPMGKRIFLRDIAEITEETGPVRIEREGQVRKVSILANYFGRDLGGISSEIKKRVENIQKSLPFGYFMEIGGQYKDMMESFKTIAWVLILSSLLSYMVMASLFENLIHPLVIMFTVPLSFIGVVFGFWIGGVNIGLPSLMGFVMLSGIAVNNGIVMIDFINRLRAQGLKKVEAIVKGASLRLRPVLITSLTTIFAVIPMIFSRSEGAEMRVSLGLTLGSGLLTATLLTLFVIPVIYSLVTREAKSE